LNRLDSYRFSLSLSLFSPHAISFLLRADLHLDPLQFGSYKLAAIHLALVLKRASRLVGRHEIKSLLSLSLSLSRYAARTLIHRTDGVAPRRLFLLCLLSLFQADSSAHIRLGLKDRTYLERGERERVWEQF